MHPLKNRTPRVVQKDRKKSQEAEEEDSLDQPEAPETRNWNPAQLKKDFYAGNLDLLDMENYRMIRTLLVRDKVRNAESMLQEAKKKQIQHKEFQKRVDDSRYKLYPRVFKGVSPLRSLMQSVPK